MYSVIYLLSVNMIVNFINGMINPFPCFPYKYSHKDLYGEWGRESKKRAELNWTNYVVKHWEHPHRKFRNSNEWKYKAIKVGIGERKGQKGKGLFPALYTILINLGLKERVSFEETPSKVEQTPRVKKKKNFSIKFDYFHFTELYKGLPNNKRRPFLYPKKNL